MSDIHFSADLSTEKLEEAIKKSNQTVGEWTDNITKAGAGIDKEMKKITDSSEDAVKKQKELIAAIEREIKELDRIMAGTFNRADVSALDKKITDAYDRLRAADEALFQMQEQQIDMNQQEEKSQGGLIASLGKWAAGIFTVSAAMKVIKDIINSTSRGSELLEENVALLKGGFQGLYRTIFTGAWSELIRNIKDTATAARDAKRELNELENILAGGEIKRANLFTGLERARTKAAEAETAAERQSYLAEAMDYQKQITDLNINEHQKRLKIDQDYYFKLTGHSKEYYDYLLTQIPTIAQNYETLYSQQASYQERLNQLRSKENQLGTWQRDADGKAILLKSGLTEAERKEQHQLQMLIMTLQDYKILQDDLSKKGQWTEYLKGIADLQRETGEGEQALVGLMRQFTAAGKASKKEIHDLNKQIEEHTSQLAAAIEAGNTAEIKSIASKIVALKEELAVREKLTEQALGAAILRADPIGRATVPKFSGTMAPKISQVLAGAPKLTLSKADQVAAEKQAEEILKRQLILRNKILDSMYQFTGAMSNALGLDEQQNQLLDEAMTTISQLAEGDFVGAAISFVTALVNGISEATSKGNQFEIALGRINAQLDKQARLLKQSAREGGSAEHYQIYLDQLNERLKLGQQMLDNLNEMMNGLSPEFYEHISEDVLGPTLAEIQQIKDEYQDFLTGGTNQNTIADSIQQGFQDGLSSARDFAETFNDFMRAAIDNAIKEASLPQISTWYQKLAADMETGGLSEAERINLQTDWEEIIRKYEQIRKEAYEAAGIPQTSSISQPSTLGGYIQRSITEETAGEWIGLIRGQKDDIRMSRDYLKEAVYHLTHLEAISKNTGDTVEELKKSNTKLDQVVTNTRAPYSGLGGG